ncbi:hypothetical protein ACP70R_031804 [Stipagrostis hirtigluma subsp. patula]
MPRSLKARTFSSPACVHAVESSDDGSPPPNRAAAAQSGEASSKKKMNKRVTKLLLPLKHRCRIPKAFSSLSRGAKKEAADDGSGDESDAESFVSATSADLRSLRTDDDDGDVLELPSFRLSPLIFPTGSVQRPPPASPVKIIRELPFGYVIGRQHDAPAPPQPSCVTFARNVKRVIPTMHLRSRSQMVKNKVVRPLKGTFRRTGWGGRGGGTGKEGDGGVEDEDVFWKKDVRGLRCRRVEEDDDPY